MWAQLCDHLIEHENEDFILNFYNKSKLNLHSIRQEYEEDPKEYLFSKPAYYTGAFNSLSHNIEEKNGSLPYEDLDDQASKDDEQISVIESTTHINKVGNISSKDDEEFDPEHLQTLQERMDEYSSSCRWLVKEYNVKDLFFHLYQQEEKLYKMKCEDKENPIRTLFLEALYQAHITNTLAIVLQEKREEEKSCLPSKEDKEVGEDLGDLNGEQKYESSLCPHDEKNDFGNTCWGR